MNLSEKMRQQLENTIEALVATTKGDSKKAIAAAIKKLKVIVSDVENQAEKATDGKASSSSQRAAKSDGVVDADFEDATNDEPETAT